MTAMGLSLQDSLPAREPLPLSWGGGLAREGLGLAREGGSRGMLLLPRVWCWAVRPDAARGAGTWGAWLEGAQECMTSGAEGVLTVTTGRAGAGA